MGRDRGYGGEARACQCRAILRHDQRDWERANEDASVNRSTAKTNAAADADRVQEVGYRDRVGFTHAINPLP